MNKLYKIILGLSVGCCAACLAAGCATADKTLSNQIAAGNNVVVEYDKMGGGFAGQQNAYLYDLFTSEQLGEGIALVAPGDLSGRGPEMGPNSVVSRSGYSLIGWYRKCELRVDENGEALDEYGELCSESKREQGYTFSGLWDFKTDRVTEDMTEDATLEGKKVKKFTLYAAWAPNCTYVFYRQETVGGKTEWVEYDTAVLPVGASSIPVPAWSDETGKLDYKSVPEYSVKSEEILDENKNPTGQFTEARSFTLAGLYKDENMSEAYAVYNDDAESEVTEETIPHPGADAVDLTTGTASHIIQRVYTTWREGKLFRVTTADNFATNILENAGEGKYIFKNDIDFTPTAGENGVTNAVAWGACTLQFKGTIVGNGFTVKALASTAQSSSVTAAGGLFGTIAKDASITDLKFEGMKFTVQTDMVRSTLGYYGLLAGRIEKGAKLEGVEIAGELHIGDLRGGNVYAETDYAQFAVGLVCGNPEDGGADAIGRENIDLKVDEVSIDIDNTTWESVYGLATAAVADENGKVTLSKYGDAESDPS